MTERRDLPLFAWGDALRARRLRRAMLRRRGIVFAAGIVLLGVTIVAPPAPRLVWNGSASAPIGLYRVDPNARAKRGDTVVAWAPPRPRRLAAERHYLPINVPLVKRVVAVGGERVCATDATISVDGRAIAKRLREDAAGRPMPWWRQCRKLANGELLLLMDAPASFDGRYFGPSRRGDVVGVATPVWVR